MGKGVMKCKEEDGEKTGMDTMMGGGGRKSKVKQRPRHKIRGTERSRDTFVSKR